MSSIRLYGRVVVTFVFLSTAGAMAAPGGARDALEATRLGLYDGADFRLADGSCKDCRTIPQALWYFPDEVIAVPRSAEAGFSRDRRVQDDVREWAQSHPDGDGSRPPLLWLGSPQVVDGVRLLDGGKTLLGADGHRLEFSLAKKIDTNLSYFDDSSARHFTDRRLKLRGRMEGDRFVARTIWPQDYDLDFARLPYRPLDAGETLEALVRADGGGARSAFAARVLWQRDPMAARKWSGMPVLALMLNGAQGDDDESHGGHFAVATGAFGPAGEWGDWLVNNFYNLDSVSEKGIIASTLTMDSYLADLNSGQSWYRPSYLLVAVLKRERAAAIYEQAIARVYNHFYRHDFYYRHSIENCAGISMQTLRSLGWKIPEQGPASRIKAVAALPLMAAKDLSVESGRQAYDYLVTEQTDLYPFAAFDAAGRDLLQRIATGGSADTRYETVLREDIEAVIFVRIPQFPSSRAFGREPVLSMDEYRDRVPNDKSNWKIVPVAPRPFPEAMKDADAPGDRSLPSLYAMYAYAVIVTLCGIAVWRYRASRRRSGVTAPK
ncbi:MAG TPA: hypothetical protein VF934_08050 [Burkholderiales bacterium]